LTVGYANTAGIATYANTAGIATYASTAGIATNLKDGTIYQIPYQTAANRTSFISTTGVTQGQLLQYNTGSAPSWTSLSNLTIGIARSITVYSDSSNLTRYIPFVDATSGITTVKTNSSLTYNPSTNLLTSTNISVTNLNISGITTLGDSTSDTVNFNARVGTGITPNGTYDLGSSTLKWGTVYANTFSGSFTGTATTSSSVAVSTDSSNNIRYITFADTNTGVSTLRTNSTLVYNPSGIGSVGIATNNPKETLDVGVGDISISSGDLNINGSIYVYNTRSGGGGFWSNGGSDNIVNLNNTSVNGSVGLTARVPGGTPAGYGDRGTGAQYIFLSGRYDEINFRGITHINGLLGIGTTNPTVALDVGVGSAYISSGDFHINGTPFVFNTRNSTGGFWSNGGNGGVANFNNYAPGGRTGFAVKLPSGSAGSFGAPNTNDMCDVLTASYNSTLNTGVVGIGTTIPIQTLHVEGSIYISGSIGIGTTNPTTKLGINGGIRCNTILPNLSNSYTLGGSDRLWAGVWVNGGVVSGSDQRDKTNITSSDLGLNFIQKLNPVSYKWIVGGNEVITDENGIEVGITSHPGKRTHYGLLSQEVKTAFEECGAEDFAGWILTDTTDSDSRQALRYEQFISPMIKAIQEQQETINQLTTTVNSLLERIQLLESK
jgi:hypothetical protein